MMITPWYKTLYKVARLSLERGLCRREGPCEEDPADRPQEAPHRRTGYAQRVCVRDRETECVCERERDRQRERQRKYRSPPSSRAVRERESARERERQTDRKKERDSETARERPQEAPHC